MGLLPGILEETLRAIEPGRLVRRANPDLGPFERIFLVGAGKASVGMTTAVVELLGDRVGGGLVVAKHATVDAIGPVAVVRAGHPVPDSRSVDAATRIVELAAGAGPEDLVLCVLSGGGSALMTLPHEGLELDQLRSLSTQLLSCGVDIAELNTVRRHLDRIKGGGLARLAMPATVISLILSDVMGNSIAAIASGPTAPDPTTFADAREVLERYGLGGHPAARPVDRGVRGELPETLKPGDPTFERVTNIVVGSNSDAVNAAVAAARKLGLAPEIRADALTGEARDVGRTLGAQLREIASAGRPACVVAGGETTVTVVGNGHGGRNLELALAAVEPLAGIEDVALVTLATDGEDGPTDAAGAFVTGATLARAHTLGLDPADFLARNDSYAFFDALGDLLRTGPTGTNVCDVCMLMALSPEQQDG